MEKDVIRKELNDNKLVEVYDNNVAENIANEQKDDANESIVIKLPKNVRQIGTIDKKSRIYIEDYVVTYLKQIAKEQNLSLGVAALYGKLTYIDNIKYVFVVGAYYQNIDETTEIEEGPTEAIINLCKNANKEWFDELLPVGVAIFHGANMHIPAKWHQKVNLARLVGRGEVFIDVQAEEEAQYSFIHDDGVEIKDGHFIYYDKNEMMQSFLVHWHEKDKLPDLEARDEIVAENCRIVLEDKKENRKQSYSVFSSVATTALILFGMCAIGFNIMEHSAEDTSSDSVLVSTLSKDQAYKETEPASFITTNDRDYDIDNSEVISSNNIDTNDNNMLSLNDFIVSQDGTEGTSVVEAQLADNQENNESQSMTDEKEITDADPEVKVDNVSSEDVINVIDEMKYSQYKIQKGDTLYEICMKKYGTVSYLNDICNRNDIEDQDSIYYGQVIELPEK